METKRKDIIILSVLVAVYAVIMLISGYPYRMFPSDDTWYYQMMEQDSFFAPDIYNPVILIFLKLMALPWLASGSLTPDILLYHTVVSNIVTIVFMYLLIREISGNRYFPFIGILLYATSSWTTKYYFFYSYSSFAASLAMVLFYLLVKSANMNGETGRIRIFLVPFLAGCIASMCVFSSISSIILIALSFPFFLFLGSGKKGILITSVKVLLYAAGFIVPTYLLIRNSFDAFLGHITENITTYHYSMADEKFSFVPTIGNFAFLKSLFIYSPLLTLVLLVILFLVIVYMIRRFLAFIGKKEHGFFCSGRAKVCCILLVTVLAQIVIIDFLPTTKLGRSYFHSFPLVIVCLVSFFSIVSEKFSPRVSRIAIAVFSGLMLAVSGFGIARTADMYHARMDLPKYISEKYAGRNIFVLDIDPYRDYITQWLADFPISTMSEQQLYYSIVDASCPRNRNIVLVGPWGKNSGNTILEHSCMNDFEFSFSPDLPYKIEYLPYFAYLPEFMLEEEISQGVLMNRMTPSPNDRNYRIKVISW